MLSFIYFFWYAWVGLNHRPTAYKAVSYPALINDKLKVLNWAIEDQEMSFSYYLNSMQSGYSLFLPQVNFNDENETTQERLIWIDPSSFALNKLDPSDFDPWDYSGRLVDAQKLLSGNSGEIKYRHVINQAEQYVKENFCDPNISLISVANHVCMSAAYFSTVFSQTTGRSFISTKIS